MAGPGDSEPRDVYFEFVSIGTSVKVVAIDGATGTEISVIAPVGTAQSDLQQLALGKLKRRLAREGA